MKQTNKLKMIDAMAVSIMVALFTASCSNDEFFGFDDEYSSNYLTEKQTVIEIKPTTYDFSEYLDIENLSLSKMTEEELVILEKAEGRLSYSVVDGYCYVHEKSASEINISEKLFHYIIDCFDNNNDFMRKIKKGKIKRTKGGDPEVIIKHDCVAHAISYMCSIDYATVDSWLSSTFGAYYTNKGVPYNALIPVVQHFRPSATNHTSYPSGGIGNNHSLHDGVLIINGSGNEYHAVNAQYYHEPGLFNNNHTVRYFEVINSIPVRDCTVIISSNSIPSTNLGGSTIIHALVY